MVDNPWNVDSIWAFTYLKCPECVFDTQEESVFRNHASENHPLSFVFFGWDDVIKKEAEKENNKENDAFKVDNDSYNNGDNYDNYDDTTENFDLPEKDVKIKKEQLDEDDKGDNNVDNDNWNYTGHSGSKWHFRSGNCSGCHTA